MSDTFETEWGLITCSIIWSIWQDRNCRLIEGMNKQVENLLYKIINVPHVRAGSLSSRKKNRIKSPAKRISLCSNGSSGQGVAGSVGNQQGQQQDS